MKWILAEIEIGRDGKEYQWVAVEKTQLRFVLLKKENAEKLVEKHNSEI